MTEHFADRLSRLIEQKSAICAGLDPRLNLMPPNTTPVAWSREIVRTLEIDAVSWGIALVQ